MTGRAPWNGRSRRAPGKGGAFQWVLGPPGASLQPEAIGAVMEVTKWLKPSNSGHELVTARVCRPQREGTLSEPRKGRCAGRPDRRIGEGYYGRGEMSEEYAQPLHRGTGGSMYTRKAHAT